jgi:hypothetical protein
MRRAAFSRRICRAVTGEGGVNITSGIDHRIGRLTLCALVARLPRRHLTGRPLVLMVVLLGCGGVWQQPRTLKQLSTHLQSAFGLPGRVSLAGGNALTVSVGVPHLSSLAESERMALGRRIADTAFVYFDGRESLTGVAVVLIPPAEGKAVPSGQTSWSASWTSAELAEDTSRTAHAGHGR